MPVLVEIEYAPVEMFCRLRHLRHVVFLDSARVHVRNGRYSILAADPLLTVCSQAGNLQVNGEDDFCGTGDNPWLVLGGLLSRFRAAEGEGADVVPPGAAIGFLAYEMGRYLEQLPPLRPPLLDAPELWFGFYDVLLVFDHQERRGWLVSSGRDKNGAVNGKRARLRFDQFQHELQHPPVAMPSSRAINGEIRPMWSRNEYEQALHKVLQYIRRGDVYQVNLTYPFSGTADLPPGDLYLQLRASNPAPFGAYLDFGSGQILSTSPERFLRMEGGRIQTRPIKGTCPRTGGLAVDRLAADELLRSVKNRAELLMITDLLRNDLGRVSEYGSVTVPSLADCEEYETVYHLVATVESSLRAGVTHLDALSACFPGGSITGAPKIRAMEIIHELEPWRRGIYTGCLGYFGFNGVSDFNILIRTILHREGRVCFSVGGGIVADSDPVLEYEETIHKARGLLNLWPSAALLEPAIA